MFDKQSSIRFNIFKATKCKRTSKERASLKVTLTTPENGCLYGFLFPHLIKEVINKVYSVNSSVKALSPVLSEKFTLSSLKKISLVQQQFVYKISFLGPKNINEEKLCSNFKFRLKNPPKRFRILNKQRHDILIGQPRGSYPGCFTTLKNFPVVQSRKKETFSNQDTSMNTTKKRICRTFSDLENEDKSCTKDKYPKTLENKFLSMDFNEFSSSLGNRKLSISVSSSNSISSDQSGFSPYKVIKLPREFKTNLLSNHKVTTSIFCKIHPYHIIFDRSMNILQIGAAILKVCFLLINYYNLFSLFF